MTPSAVPRSELIERLEESLVRAASSLNLRDATRRRRKAQRLRLRRRPRVLTDLTGFVCLVPACLRWLRGAILRRLERAVRSGRMGVTVNVGAAEGPFGRRPMKNVTPRSRD